LVPGAIPASHCIEQVSAADFCVSIVSLGAASISTCAGEEFIGVAGVARSPHWQNAQCAAYQALVFLGASHE
jgi:hypothetical protein